jgi:SAM-dependent methyltransferase
MEPTSTARTVDRHYGRTGLRERIFGGLRLAGKDLERLTPDDLAPVDHFHLRGKDATLELARLAGLAPGTRVLDLGGGLGGPARALAHEQGCHVTVLDLTEEFCRVGEELTGRTGLAGRVRFHHGDALDLPFPDASFEVGWTQHSTMNIQDKPRLLSEIARVVAPGGRLATHEIVAGPGGPVHFPVPWARDASISFLLPAAQFRAAVAAAGFREVAWRDGSAAAVAWIRERAVAAAAQGPPPLGIHLLFDDDVRPMLATLRRNLEEGRVAAVMGVWERAPRTS